MTRQLWDVVADEFEAVQRLRDDYPTPGALAQRLDPTTVQTPALEIIDAHLVQVRNAIAVMYARRARFAELVRQDVDEEEAIEQTVSEIPPAGIDRLLISFCPQQGKSSRVTRYGILRLLRQFPMLRVGLVSYDGANANQFGYQIRADIELFNGVSDSSTSGYDSPRTKRPWVDGC
jgi:hypothetical protein